MECIFWMFAHLLFLSNKTVSFFFSSALFVCFIRAVTKYNAEMFFLERSWAFWCFSSFFLGIESNRKTVLWASKGWWCVRAHDFRCANAKFVWCWLVGWLVGLVCACAALFFLTFHFKWSVNFLMLWAVYRFLSFQKSKDHEMFPPLFCSIARPIIRFIFSLLAYIVCCLIGLGPQCVCTVQYKYLTAAYFMSTFPFVRLELNNR